MREPEVDAHNRVSLGQGSRPESRMTNEAKYRPAESLTRVTDDGSDGSGRDHRTGTSPIFGSRSFPFGSTRKRELAVKRIACRRSLRDRNLGFSTFGPLRVPVREAKKFRYAMFRSARACWSTTEETSLSHARSGCLLDSGQPDRQIRCR